MENSYRNFAVIQAEEFKKLTVQQKRQLLLSRISTLATTVAGNIFLPNDADRGFTEMALRAVLRLTVAACAPDLGKSLYRAAIDKATLDADADWAATLTQMALEPSIAKEADDGLQQSSQNHEVQATVPTVPVEATSATESGGHEPGEQPHNRLRRGRELVKSYDHSGPNSRVVEFTRHDDID